MGNNQQQLIPQGTGPSVPWRGKELPHFWAMLRSAGISRAALRDMLKVAEWPEDIRDLNKDQWGILLAALKKWTTGQRRDALRPRDPHHGRASDEQWEKILVLQKELQWTDEHRDNYIRKHGHIADIRFMTVPIARAIITGMEKIKAWKEEQGDRQEEAL